MKPKFAAFFHRLYERMCNDGDPFNAGLCSLALSIRHIESTKDHKNKKQKNNDKRKKALNGIYATNSSNLISFYKRTLTKSDAINHWVFLYVSGDRLYSQLVMKKNGPTEESESSSCVTFSLFLSSIYMDTPFTKA